MGKRPILVLGAGGHSKVLINALLEQDLDILGIIDSDTSKIGMEILGIKVIGNDSDIKNYCQDDILLVNGIGSVDSMALRKKIYLSFKRQGYAFAKVIHPRAIIGRTVELGEGVQIMAGSILQPGCSIGENTIINTSVSIDHDSKIGSHVHIAPGSVLSGNVIVGNCTHIGIGCTIIQGKHIGHETLLGAGSLVLKDIRSNVRVFGVPAKEVE